MATRRRQELWVFLHGKPVGAATRSRRGAVLFEYLPGAALPLSVSLPLAARRTLDISAWIDGLLPDNPSTRSRMSLACGAASVEPFDLLSTEAGLECAGAVQFWPQAELPEPRTGALVRLSDAEVAARLERLAEEADGGPRLAGLADLRLSLAGAQPKMALRLTGSGWCLPAGAEATTHILKPQQAHLNPRVRESIAVNEHLCQTAAVKLGLGAAVTSLALFGGRPCLVTERFDRRIEDGDVRRSHFEDFCQALGLPPDRKYQPDGGPAPEAVVGMLRRETGAGGARRFLLAMFYNWLIGNTDGHAKNYGLLLGASRHRLAPLYDLSSAVPYTAQGSPPGMAMRFADAAPATPAQWAQAGAALGARVGEDEFEAVASGLRDAFGSAAADCPDWAIETAETLAGQIGDHARSLRRSPGTGSARARMDAPAVRLCGETVARTGKPCLLRAGHRGRHRSVL